MNHTLNYIVFAILIICSSCTDVIDVEVPNASPRLVVEASIDWEKGTAGNEQSIQLSTSTPFFDSQSIDIVTGAEVSVTNMDDGNVFIFEDQNNGNYTTQNFIPIVDGDYLLEIKYNGDIYQAQERLIPVVDISNVYQSTENGFDDEALEVNVTYVDSAGIDNYYLFKFQKEGALLPELQDISDEFTDGNETTLFYELLEDEDINQKEFEPGDIVNIDFFGISERYFNFIQLLISQNEDGGPFSATPVSIRGNCVNLSNQDQYAYGYFRVTQTVKTSYTFE